MAHLIRVSDHQNPSLPARSFVRTQAHFWAIHTHAHLPYPGTYPRCSALGHDQQCAMRAARFIMSFWKGLFILLCQRQFQGVQPACLRMLKGRSVSLDLGEGKREGWSFASPGWRLCRMGQSIVSHETLVRGLRKPPQPSGKQQPAATNCIPLFFSWHVFISWLK